MTIDAVAQRHDGGKAWIGMPLDPLALDVRVKGKRGIILMKRMIIAAGQERLDRKINALSGGEQPPGENDNGSAFGHEHFMFDFEVVVDQICPLRPGMVCKLRNAFAAIRMNNIRRVSIRGKGRAAVGSFHPGFHSIDQHDATGGRRSSGDEKTMVAARANAAFSSGGKAAEAVRL